MEPGKSTVKETLRTLAAVNPEEATKRRSRARAQSAAAAKVIKKAAVLADLITDEDIEECAKALREAMQATRPYFNFETKQVERLPDHNARLTAVALILAYTEGLPVQRVRQDHVHQETTEEIMARFRQSPAAMAALLAGQKVGVKWAIDGQVIDVEASVQETVAANL